MSVRNRNDATQTIGCIPIKTLNHAYVYFIAIMQMLKWITLLKIF